MKMIVIGATGATGKSLLPLLAAHSEIERIDCFGRRHPDFSHQKLNSHQIDFSKPDNWREEVQGDVLFACLGTTLKAAGSKEAQWAIDYEANLEFAKVARQNGVNALVLVSASGANSASRLFYQRMKGELEQAIIALNFPRLIIFRPPLLIRPNSDRLGEKMAERIFRVLNRIGMLKNQRPLAVEKLAQAMLKAALLSSHEQASYSKNHMQVYEPQDIFRLLDQ
ncbi:NAD(P)H-binding protein [Neisseria flavescens]|uniref:NAD(P)H-binding protein n=1 Tax=Neisseria flavescens TaxID=484 RepID=UPI0007A572FD|nr:NAD(P)H-binding protein [Neisseria flavescens]